MAKIFLQLAENFHILVKQGSKNIQCELMLVLSQLRIALQYPFRALVDSPKRCLGVVTFAGISYGSIPGGLQLCDGMTRLKSVNLCECS